MTLDDCAARIYTLENECERLREQIKYMREEVTRAILLAESDEFRFARRTPLWMEGFTCGKAAAAANVQSILNG